MTKPSLADTYPELAAQWHPTKNGKLIPDQVTPGISKKVWWRCTKGHEWQATISNRSCGTSCPYCAGKLPIPGKTDLATLNPTIAAEWNPIKNPNLNPTQVTLYSNKKVWWLGPCGHEYQSTIANRTRGRGCPYCSGRLLIPGKTDLATTNPALAAQWHPNKNGSLTPTQAKAGSDRMAWWLCPTCNHEWLASIKNRSHGTACPHCDTQKNQAQPIPRT